ncbi:hypothetical protein [Vibrio phage vB_VibM_10AMN]|uniref:Uncharacterized protein n=1 Tax=Staphylococcus phage vB_VibM_10AMN12 TaxID=3076785 RepID=A0AA96KSV2_9CAUD|nr:hypothetical protein [Vibrio phage vB_VibM_10AMN]WNO47428.1 hypothetical protein [Staphylococcus phage vB_VibM_10AMN12]
MKTYNLTHQYLIEESDVYFKTSLPLEMIEDAIALIHFTVEEQVSNSVSVYEEFLVEALKCVLPLKVKDAKKKKDAPKVDQYVVRELRCGKFYKTNWNKWLTTPQYKVVWELVQKRKDLWED